MQIESWVRLTKQQLETKITDNLTTDSPYGQVLVEAMLYAVESSGKRIRPLLFLALLDQQGKDLADFYFFAAALELLHCYTLVHDDLPAMDDDDFRRGKPSTHKKFGEGTAILAGDALLTLAFEWMARPLPLPLERQLAAMAIVAKKLGFLGVVGGQQADLDAERAVSFDDKENLGLRLEWIHHHKTAVFFEACLEAAAVLQGASLELKSQLISFGGCFGQFFQIQNDLQAAQHQGPELPRQELPLGPAKEQHSDHSKHKLTYLTLYGQHEAEKKAKACKEKALFWLTNFSSPLPTLRQYAETLLL